MPGKSPCCCHAILHRSEFRGVGNPARVSGTCARKEGLRILTSPRREASLFKLGRAFGFRPIFFWQAISAVGFSQAPAAILAGEQSWDAIQRPTAQLSKYAFSPPSGS